MTDMYQKISIYAFLITVIGIGISYIIRPERECLKHPVRTLVHAFTLIFLDQKLSFAGAIRKLVYLLALFSFVVLGITGFYPTLVKGEHISGYLIMIHATFAPILAICLAALAVMWAGKCVFNTKDWPWLQRIIERLTLVKIDNNSSDIESSVWQKISFWLIVFLALPLIMSIILSMLPYFGTHWQEILIFIHRYTALVFAIVVLIHTHLIVIAQLRK
ncbi:MAG: hypothetical protein JXA96_15005 [Sedimentisphaerales bacterium]|nr:hypothetical protein [Sedimentisphaerales bacterium]